MIDAGVVMVENAHKHLERRQDKRDERARIEAILAACREVGPALFFSLLIIAVSFLPVFTLEAQEGSSSRRSPTPRPSPCSAARC